MTAARTFSLSFALCACASAAPQVAAVDVRVSAEQRVSPARVRVVLEREQHIGQRFRVMRRSRLLRTRSVYEGEILRDTPTETDREVELEAIATVLAMEPDGGVLEMQYEVERFEWLRGAPDEGSTVLAAGTVVVVRRGEHGEFYVDGERPYGDVHEALRLAIDATRDENQDELFGTSEPQPVGGQWGIGSEAVAEAMSSPRSPVDANEVSGTASLVSMDSSHYEVRATWHVETEDEEWQAKRVVHGDGVVRYARDVSVPPLDAELELRQDWEITRGTERHVTRSEGWYITRRRPLPDR